MQVGIVNLLKTQPGLTVKELADLLGVSSRTVERHIKELRENGTVRRIGSDKSGSRETIG